MIDDDDKNLTRVMIGGAVLVNILVFAVGYDAGLSICKQNKFNPTIIHGNLTINNNSNNSSQPLPLAK